MSEVVIRLNEPELKTGYAFVVKKDEKGFRRGWMDLESLSGLLNEVFRWDMTNRQIRMVSRFDQTLIAYGQNGAKWSAVAEIPPADYYLVSATGKAYQVRLPRLVVFVGNHIDWPRIFWTDAETVTADTKIYPLIIGNTYVDGRVCTGTTGLKCKTPEEIDRYVRQLIESPASHTVTGNTDRLYRALTKRWAPGIGRKYCITVGTLIKGTPRERWT